MAGAQPLGARPRTRAAADPGAARGAQLRLALRSDASALRALPLALNRRLDAAGQVRRPALEGDSPGPLLAHSRPAAQAVLSTAFRKTWHRPAAGSNQPGPPCSNRAPPPPAPGLPPALEAGAGALFQRRIPAVWQRGPGHAGGCCPNGPVWGAMPMTQLRTGRRPRPPRCPVCNNWNSVLPVRAAGARKWWCPGGARGAGRAAASCSIGAGEPLCGNCGAACVVDRP